MLDKFKDDCGVFGIHGHSEAANLAYLGLYAMQHRGQESAALLPGSAEHAHLAGLRVCEHVAGRTEEGRDLPAEQILDSRRAAAVAGMAQVRAGLL